MCLIRANVTFKIFNHSDKMLKWSHHHHPLVVQGLKMWSLPPPPTQSLPNVAVRMSLYYNMLICCLGSFTVMYICIFVCSWPSVHHCVGVGVDIQPGIGVGLVVSFPLFHLCGPGFHPDRPCIDCVSVPIRRWVFPLFGVFLPKSITKLLLIIFFVDIVRPTV